MTQHATHTRVATLEEVIAAHVSESYCPSAVIAASVRLWIADQQMRLRSDANAWYAQGWNDMVEILTDKEPS
jgi:hypothetical protein